jgi:hypothetical protein
MADDHGVAADPELMHPGAGFGLQHPRDPFNPCGPIRVRSLLLPLLPMDLDLLIRDPSPCRLRKTPLGHDLARLQLLAGPGCRKSFWTSRTLA